MVQPIRSYVTFKFREPDDPGTVPGSEPFFFRGGGGSLNVIAGPESCKYMNWHRDINIYC